MCSLGTAYFFYLQLVHWAFVSIAILESVAKLKMEWIEFRKEPKLITETGISLVVLLTRLYTVKVIASMSQKMEQLLEKKPTGGGSPIRSGQSSGSRRVEITMGFMLAFSICLSITSVIFGTTSFKMWSFSLQQRGGCQRN